MSETRKITVTGGAAVFSVEGSESTSKTRRRRSTAPALPSTILKVGGSPPITTPAITVPAKEIKQIKVQESVAPEIESTPSPVPQTSKVILGGKKPKHMKVLLTKKNHDGAETASEKKESTAKPNRKVSLGLSHLKRRVTRARKVSKLSKTAPIEQIRKELITAHIIKETSKAPEHILRQMYADAKVLTSKSL